MFNVGVVALMIVCVMIGWVGKGLTYKQPELKPVMAYGLEETGQYWNRIRVNDKGHVICAKE